MPADADPEQVHKAIQATAHARLQQLHQRALDEEKLSSPGTMAAGVAHEINNPRSRRPSSVPAPEQRFDTPRG